MHCLLVYGINKCWEFLEDTYCCPDGNGKETQSEDTFRKDVGCITGVASQTCPPVNAAATEMLVPLAFLPYPGMMKRVVGIGMKRTRSVGNGSGTTSTRDRWVCAKWAGLRGGGVHRGSAVSFSDSLKGFQAPVTVNYFILVLLAVFHFLYLCFCSVSIFWPSPIIGRNAVYSCAGFSAVLSKRSLLVLMPMVVVKTDFPIQFLLNIPIAEVNFWHWFLFFVFLALFWHLFNAL